ncbi:MAG: hypothetical protein BZY88_04630 [SAR202 cluster bacterium Io17-Chloro-G9]|nr:MAG: hypothetical protein BZY88_04630 [SAR202 cluster bacterium Io17-Chloro-G9]
MSIAPADQHDLDKLARWHQDISGGGADRFPVFCVFLVTPADLASHQVFRRYRTSFEDRAAGFQHLVIFGQHARSTTSDALLAEFGLTQEQAPTLAVVSTQGGATVHTIPLAQGDEAADGAGDEAWQRVLRLVECAADGEENAVGLDAITEAKPHPLGGESLPDVVSRLLARLS